MLHLGYEFVIKIEINLNWINIGNIYIYFEVGNNNRKF